ncbi:MAG: molybdopterin molybdotransferase MoeA [Croceitalea sp.]|nr:molybdopterin molybdotransferase MoeA [Croceitalea sp.]
MISFDEAYKIVLDSHMDFGTETVDLKAANGRVLAEHVKADRNFPPFDRATKDGIAIKHGALTSGERKFKILDIAPAGTPQKKLGSTNACIEIMTGAIVPIGADTIIMYEHLTIEDEFAIVNKPVTKGQNIHKEGSDVPQGAEVLAKGSKITSAAIGVLASVGKAKVLVKKLPKICVVSTGDELVNVEEVPKAHQIRKSNSYSLKAALQEVGISAEEFHIIDDKNAIRKAFQKLLNTYDVMLLSGGVSMGKFDYLPELLEEAGVTPYFHRVNQRPGKPFWFGQNKTSKTTVFAFPGNPASTFASYHIYFLGWLNQSLHLPSNRINVLLSSAFENEIPLTRFLRAKVEMVEGVLSASLILGNGSGDLTSLAQANGFVQLNANTSYTEGELVPFVATSRIL